MNRKLIAYIILFAISFWTNTIIADDCSETFDAAKKYYSENKWNDCINECVSYSKHCGSHAQIESMLKECKNKIRNLGKKPIKPKPPTKINAVDGSYTEKYVPPTNTVFSVDKKYIEFPAQGGTKQITVNSSNDWLVFSSPWWIDYTQHGNTLTLMCNENYKSSAREEEIILTDYDNELHIVVSQDRSKYYLNFSSNIIEDKGDGKIIHIINVSSNLSWNIKNKPQWCDIEINNNQLRILLDMNKTGYERKSEIEVVAEQSNADMTNLRGIIHIYQASLNNYIFLDSNVITDDSGNGGAVEIGVDTDMEYYSIVNIPSWCNVSQKDATSFVIEINDNSGGYAREAQCYVKAGNARDTLTIRQADKLNYVNVSANRVNSRKNGGIIDINVKSSGAWRIVNLPDWCRVENETENSFTLIVMRNEGTPRSATFSISSSGIRKDILVNQE